MKWISVKDELPDAGDYVICASHLPEDKGWWFGCCQYNGYFPYAMYGRDDPIDFWARLDMPDLPEVEE